MIGPPGTGKSMLASRLPGLPPPMPHDAALEAAAIQSLSSQGFRANIRSRDGVRRRQSLLI
ncbi:MAG: ATP-binding protein [Burkholderiales bacterium]|nr:ATP-binding protein [Burkholderiales bacterium]